MVVVGFHGKTINVDVKKLIHEYRVGNFILFSRNIGTPEEVYDLTSGLQAEAKKAGHEKPLLICLDQENGIVRRLKEPTSIFPGPMSLGAVNDPEMAEQIGLATGRELRELGINWNLAPVVDVNNNPKNPVINVRSFGESPQKVAELSTRWFKGLQQAGVASTLKHFPGHGDTDVDSHLDLPVISHSLERLFELELVPFIEGIRQGTDVIMSAHIYFSALEKEFGKPATLSKEVLTGLLRKRLGFTGVVTTDCLEMNAILNTVGVSRGAVEAVKAGADITMISHTFNRQISGIESLVNAVLVGEITEDQITESYQRIVDLKNKYTSMWDEYIGPNRPLYQYIGSMKHKELAINAYQKSVCYVTHPGHIKNFSKKILAILPKNAAANRAEDKQELSAINSALKTYSIHLTHYEVNDCETLQEISQEYEQKIIFLYSLTKEDSYFKAIQPISNQPNTLLISLRGPYPIQEFQGNTLAICVYDDTPAAIHSALDVGLGIKKATGQLPVSHKDDKD